MLSVCLLIGCGGLTRFDEDLPPCADPVDLPDRALSDQDIEVFWGRDRVALLDCAAKVEVLSGRGVVDDGDGLAQ
jgi:hypothetical protein